MMIFFLLHELYRHSESVDGLEGFLQLPEGPLLYQYYSYLINDQNQSLKVQVFAAYQPIHLQELLKEWNRSP